MGKTIPLSIRDQVYESVRGDILASRYTPGEELQIDRLASEYGVSTTPIREALLRLTNVGLVVLSPNKGARVAPIDAEHTLHIFELRLLLETYAARQTMVRSPNLDLDSLEARVRQILSGTYQQQDYRETDLAVHEMLYEHLPNVLLKDIMRNLYQLSIRIRYFAQEGRVINHEIVAAAADEHLAIISAFKLGSAEKVEEAVRQHIIKSRDRTLQAISGRGAPV
jgi:DNA-binding GntR family transcriptional regulator